jgi:hypothetical protein
VEEGKDYSFLPDEREEELRAQLEGCLPYVNRFIMRNEE